MVPSKEHTLLTPIVYRLWFAAYHKMQFCFIVSGLVIVTKSRDLSLGGRLGQRDCRLRDLTNGVELRKLSTDQSCRSFVITNISLADQSRLLPT